MKFLNKRKLIHYSLLKYEVEICLFPSRWEYSVLFQSDVKKKQVSVYLSSIMGIFFNANELA
jgi:hypothetical protein